MHSALARQLRRTLGIDSETHLAAVLNTLADLGEQPGVTDDTRRVLAGLKDFIGRVELSYQQFERDIDLRSRSLQLSSEELITANQRLSEELASRVRAIYALQETAQSLQEEIGWTDTAHSNNDLEHLSGLISGLVTYREQSRREVEAAKHALENQIFALDQHAIVSITDTAGTITYANDKFCQISGYTLTELLGQNHRIVNSGVHPPAFFTEMWKTIKSGQVWQGEICNRAKNGKLYWVAATVVPFLDEQGHPTQYAGIRTDITDRRNTMDELREQLHFVRELIEAIPLPVYFKDVSGCYIGMNRAFESSFGTTRDQLIGQTIYSLLPFELADFHTARDTELFAQPGPQAYEWEMPALAGHAPRTLIYQKAPLTWQDGSIRGLIGIILDVSERKIWERGVLQAKEAAEAANRAKSDFLANMSHEIRTPMNGIIGMTELTLDTDLTDQQKEYLRIVKSSAESLLTIINDILDFSKIEAGKMIMEQTSFSLAELVGETLKALALRTHQKDLELVCRMDPGLPEWVKGDPGRLRQVLSNLIGNAIKFTDRGEIVLQVSPTQDSNMSETIRFSVTDTGIGIPADKQQHIFEAFTQEDSSTTRRYGGTGLGLTISSRLVAMMGGQIWLESSPGSGSTFYFTAQLSPGLSSNDKPLTRDRLAGLAALVVDDNAVNRRLLTDTLALWGLQVSAVDCGVDALNILREKHFDLMLLDALMPEMDGFQTAKEIQSMSLANPPLILMLSSAGMKEDMNNWQFCGIASYLTKPVLQSELLSSLLTLFGREQGQQGKLVEAAPATAKTLPVSMRILLVEDHPVNQKLALSLLEKWGQETTLATNGEDALALLAAHHFDLVLMDVQLPVLDGLEATRRHRAREIESHTPVIAMTANAMEGDRETCLAAGMDDYLSKPVKATELLEMLQRYQPLPTAAQGEFDYAAALAGVDQEVVDIIAETFLDQCPRDLDAMRQAIASHNLSELQRIGHGLKGSVALFDAQPMVELAREIEHIIPRDEWHDALRIIERLAEQFARFSISLRNR